METKETIKYYDESVKNMIDSLQNLETQLDQFAKASDLLVSNLPVNLRFYNRVNIGLITESFSQLLKVTQQHMKGIKTALTPKEVPEIPAEVPAAPKGEVSES